MTPGVTPGVTPATVTLDYEETRKERAAYLATTMDAARVQIRQQRLQRSADNAVAGLYGSRI